MAHRVIYLERDGKQSVKLLPTLTVATIYARGVKNGKVEPGGSDDNINVIKCPDPHIVMRERFEQAAKAPADKRICACGKPCGKQTACYGCRRYA